MAGTGGGPEVGAGAGSGAGIGAEPDRAWHRVAGPGELGEGRVRTVTVGRRSLALCRVADGRYGALDNRCPHQGGPLGEGSIENGWLRCPWHGYDYSPLTGQPPEGFSDAPACHEVEARDDGVWVRLPVERPRGRTVSDVLVDTMVNWGVRAVFGMVGHSNLGFADALRVAEERGDLRFIGVRHEGAAAFAASAYGKLTGELAACLAIAGPGSTNLLTGLYDAKVDRAPVLALSGQVPSKTRGRGAFQDVDVAAAFADVAAYSEVVSAGSDHAELMTLACKTALVTGGVGHLVLPDEVQEQPVSTSTRVGGPAGRVGSTAVAPPAGALAAAGERIAGARRPLIIVGHGARRHMGAVLALAEAIGAPVATTFKAKGAIGDDHPLACGVLGRSGTPVASWVMNESDLIVVFGASFANHTGIAPYKPLVQVDHDPMALGRFHPVEVAVLGDIGVTAGLLASELARVWGSSGSSSDGRPVVGPTPAVDQRAELAGRWALWRAEKASRAADDAGRGLASAAVFAELSAAVPAGAVLCVDVGNNAYSFGRYMEVAGDTDVLMSGYLGSIGFAFPAAMGAWAAVQGRRPVVSVSGDGGFGQYAMELTTAVANRMRICHVLLDNGELGKISKEQRAGELDVWHTGLHNPDFAAFARLCGAEGFTVNDPGELRPALSAALAVDGPSLVAIRADPGLV